MGAFDWATEKVDEVDDSKAPQTTSPIPSEATWARAQKGRLNRGELANTTPKTQKTTPQNDKIGIREKNMTRARTNNPDEDVSRNR